MNTLPRLSRRRFLGLSGVGIGLLAPVRGPRAFAAVLDARHADLVVFNAKIHTMNSRSPTAEACAVKEIGRAHV